MYYLCYKSKCNANINESEIIKILNTAQKNNLQNEITGMLLYINDNFLQILEGEESVLEKLLENIAKDPRHYSLKILSEGKSNQRFFKNWVMGFRTLNEIDLKEMQDLNNVGKFTIEELLSEANNHIAVELLKSFYINGEIDYYKFWSGK